MSNLSEPVADAYFFWCFRRASRLDLDVSRFANCAAHFERMQARESVRKLVAFEAETRARFSATV